MKTILTVVGARPQIIKAGAVSRAVKGAFSGRLRELIIHTGQHYDHGMSQVFFDEMGIPAPDRNLLAGSGSHGQQTARMMSGIEEVLLELKPDAVLVYGDTNSTLAAAIAASKLHFPVVHVEAGLRSFDKRMPEEINRIACDHVSTLLFSPTRQGMLNLRREGFDLDASAPYSINRPGVFRCGDVMLDNTLYFADRARQTSDVLKRLGLAENEFALVTLHRDSNTDDLMRLASICRALLTIAGTTRIAFPVHPRTRAVLDAHAQAEPFRTLLHHPEVVITTPLSFLDMVELERSCSLILTDSGGVQKEAYFLRRPAIVFRPHTEWVELVETGHARLADADEQAIVKAYTDYRSSPPSSWPDIFGDGRAAEFICSAIDQFLG